MCQSLSKYKLTIIITLVIFTDLSPFQQDENSGIISVVDGKDYETESQTFNPPDKVSHRNKINSSLPKSGKYKSG